VTTLKQIAQSCPLPYWVKEHKHCISIELVTGQTLVVRTALKDLKGFKCTADMLRKVTPWLQDKSNDVLDALAALVDARMLQLTQNQLVIAEQVTLILRHMTAGDYIYTMTTLIPALAHVMAEYGDGSLLPIWRTWLESCVLFCYVHAK